MAHLPELAGCMRKSTICLECVILHAKLRKSRAVHRMGISSMTGLDRQEGAESAPTSRICVAKLCCVISAIE